MGGRDKILPPPPLGQSAVSLFSLFAYNPALLYNDWLKTAELDPYSLICGILEPSYTLTHSLYHPHPLPILPADNGLVDGQFFF